jgi:hypothetical protein
MEILSDNRLYINKINTQLTPYTLLLMMDKLARLAASRLIPTLSNTTSTVSSLS